MSMSFELMMKNKSQDVIYAVIRGTLTNNNGLYSGFTATDYLRVPQEIDITQPFEVNVRVNNFSATSSTQYILGFSSNITIGFYLGGSATGIGCSYGSSYWNGLASGMTVDMPFDFKIQSNGTNITVTITQGSYTKTSTKTISELGITQNLVLFLGRNASTSGNLPFTSGTINLNKTYIKLDGVKYQVVVSIIYAPALDGTESIFTFTGKVPPTINNNVFGGGIGWLLNGWDNTGLWCLNFYAKCEVFTEGYDGSGVAVVLNDSTNFEQNSINVTSMTNITIFNNGVKTTAEDDYYKTVGIRLNGWTNINIEKLTSTTFSLTMGNRTKSYNFANLSAKNMLCLGVNSWGNTYCYIKDIEVYAK